MTLPAGDVMLLMLDAALDTGGRAGVPGAVAVAVIAALGLVPAAAGMTGVAAPLAAALVMVDAEVLITGRGTDGAADTVTGTATAPPVNIAAGTRITCCCCCCWLDGALLPPLPAPVVATTPDRVGDARAT